MGLHRHAGCINRYNGYDKVREGVATPLQSNRLLDQVRERIRYLHYSLQTEKAYMHGTRFFVFTGYRGSGAWSDRFVDCVRPSATGRKQAVASSFQAPLSQPRRIPDLTLPSCPLSYTRQNLQIVDLKRFFPWHGFR